MNSPRLGRLFGAVALTVVLTVLSGLGADRLILKLATEHQTASPELSMAAAMGGLFAAGLVGLLAVLILSYSGSKP